MYMCQCELEHAQARRDLKGMTASAPTPDQMERDDNHEPASLPAPKKNTSIMQVFFLHDRCAVAQRACEAAWFCQVLQLTWVLASRKL